MLAKKARGTLAPVVDSPFPETEPTSYSTIETISTAMEWKAPESGYFTIELFGASGRGGYASTNNSQRYIYGESYDSEGNRQYEDIPRRGSTYGTGGGGKSGGYSKSIVKLMKGDILELSPGGVGVTSTVKIHSSVADTNYSTMTVTAGASGGNGAAGSISEGGYSNSSGGAAGTSGGVASGGNSANRTGYNGGAGNSSSGTYGRYNGGAGGTAVISGARAGGAGAGVTTGTSTMNDYYNGSYINNQHTVYYAGSPGAGQAGYVKISRGNTNVVA